MKRMADREAAEKPYGRITVEQYSLLTPMGRELHDYWRKFKKKMYKEMADEGTLLPQLSKGFKIFKRGHSFTCFIAADKRGRTPERPGNGTDAADRARGSGGNGEVGDLRRDDVVDKAEKEEKDKSLKRSSRNRLRRNRRRLRKAVTLLSRTVFLFLRAKRRVFARISDQTCKKLEAENRFAMPAEQEELDKKRARFNEVMEILNPPEEQQIADDEDEQYDYGDRPVKKEEKKKRKGNWYSQEEVQFLIWSHGSASVGEVRTFFRYKKWRYYEKTADGCVELSARQYEKRRKDIATETYRRATSDIGETPNIVRSSGATERGNSDGDRYATESGSVYRQALGEELRSDTGRGVSTVGRSSSGSQVRLNDDEQYQQRTDTLTDRRVLELAAEDVRIDDLTQGEVYALDVFKKRLETIRDLQAQRKEQGRYRGRKDCLTGEAEILNLCLF